MAQGTLDDPMTLAEALTSDRIQPGHTVYLSPGTYTLADTMAASLSGTVDAVVQVKPRSTQPTIDTQDANIDWVAGSGAYCRLSNLHFLSSLEEARDSEYASGAPPPDITRTWLDVQGGTGGALYNATIHDMANVGWSKSVGGGLLADSQIFNIGYTVQGATGGGHCMYAQNYAASPAKTIRNCIMNGTLGFMLALKGSSATEVYNFVIENSIFIGGTQRFGQDGAPTGNITIKNSVFWNTHLHFQGHSAATGTNITIENCIVAANNHNIIKIADSTFQNNTVIQLVSFTGLFICDPRTGNTWDNNAYTWIEGANPEYKPFGIADDTVYDFEDWKTLTGFDEHSTFTTDSPSGTQQFVFACDVLSAPRVAHIAVFNWEELGTVDVDVSELEMQVNGNYRLRNAYDPLDDYDDFVYDGSGVVTVSFVGRGNAVPLGAVDPILTLDARFGAWILEALD